MTRKFGKFAILAGAILAAGPVTVKAQDFFREYGSSRSSGGIGPVTPTDYSSRIPRRFLPWIRTT